MGFKCGILGLPNVGKSTLFNAITKSAIPAENFPFCTIDPNVGVVMGAKKSFLSEYLKGAVEASLMATGTPLTSAATKTMDFHCLRPSRPW